MLVVGVLGCKYQQISCIWGGVGSTMPHQRKPKVLIETFGFCLSSIIDNGLITGLFSAIRWTVSL